MNSGAFTVDGQKNVWLPRRGRARDTAAVRLFCLPFAGGSTLVYQPWFDAFPDAIDVCPIELPGRSSRFAEPHADTLRTMVERMADAITPCLDRPWAIFGHSMGATLGYELAVIGERLGRAKLLHLFAAGSAPPHAPHQQPPWAALSDEAFRARLQSLGGTPDDVMADAELLECFLPVLKADLAMHDDYEWVARPPLDCAVSAFGGDTDPSVSTDDLAGWQSVTTGRFRTRVFSGNHFFLDTAAPALCAAICDALLCGPDDRHDDRSQPVSLSLTATRAI